VSSWRVVLASVSAIRESYVGVVERACNCKGPGRFLVEDGGRGRVGREEERGAGMVDEGDEGTCTNEGEGTHRATALSNIP